MQALHTACLRIFTIVPVVRPFCEFGSLIDLLPTHTPPRGGSPLLCATTVVQLVPRTLSRACLVWPWRGLPLGAGLLPRHVCSCRADCSSSLRLVVAGSLQPENSRLANVCVCVVEHCGPCAAKSDCFRVFTSLPLPYRHFHKRWVLTIAANGCDRALRCHLFHNCHVCATSRHGHSACVVFQRCGPRKALLL